MGKSQIIWSMKELTATIRERQLNKFDANIGISGSRGNGKSTFLFKVFNSFKTYGFQQRKHQVYSRDKVIELLSKQKFSFCWDDEAINSGYKRDFQNQGQIELIKIVTQFRDNFNVYASALPMFFNLDKALRELIFMHIHIVERGLAVIFLSKEGQIHNQDPWDVKTNKMIEAKENKRLESTGDTNFKYHKFTTFAGYVYFGEMSKRQEEKYLKLKAKGREDEFAKKENVGPNRTRSFEDKIVDFTLAGKLSKKMLLNMCLLEDKKYSTTLSILNKRLKDRGLKTAGEYLLDDENEKPNKTIEQIDNLVPDI